MITRVNNDASKYEAIDTWDTMISFQFTGMNMEEQSRRIEALRMYSNPEKKYFCSIEHEGFLKGEGMGSDQIYEWCLAQQNSCKMVVFLIAGDKESAGMNKELEYALKHKQYVMTVVHEDQKSLDWVQKFISQSNVTCLYENTDDLLEIKI